MTKSYRRGYSSTMTSTALRGCAPLRAYLGGVATAAAARDRQVAVLEEAMRQGPSPAPRSAVLLYARLLALLRVSATSTSAEAVARLHRDLKEQFPMSCTAMELEQASLRGAFEKCTGKAQLVCILYLMFPDFSLFSDYVEGCILFRTASY